MIRTNEYIIPATVLETGEEVMVNNPAECSDNPWGFYSESWHFTKDGRVFHDDELEFRKFKKGDAVVITSMKAGGEIVNTEREDGLIEVKVANMVIVREFYIYLVRVFSRLSMERLNEAQNEAMRQGKFMIEPQKKKYIKSYLEGVPFGLDENYKSLAPTSAETGLMVTHKAVIKSYLERKHKNLRTGRHPKLEVEEDAFGVGYQDGRKVSLNKQIEKNNKLERYGNNTV